MFCLYYYSDLLLVGSRKHRFGGEPQNGKKVCTNNKAGLPLFVDIKTKAHGDSESLMCRQILSASRRRFVRLPLSSKTSYRVVNRTSALPTPRMPLSRTLLLRMSDVCLTESTWMELDMWQVYLPAWWGGWKAFRLCNSSLLLEFAMFVYPSQRKLSHVDIVNIVILLLLM